MEFNDLAVHFRAVCDGGGACLEVAFCGNLVLLRGSRMPEMLVAVNEREWDEFVQGVKKGALDGR